MCPVRQFQKRKQLQHHLERYHSQCTPGVLSTNMLRCLVYRDDVQTTNDVLHTITGMEPMPGDSWPLHTASLTMRNQLLMSPSWEKHAMSLAKVGT